MHFSEDRDRTVHTTAFDKPVVDHWLERKIAQTAAESTEKDRSDDRPLQRRARYRLSYIPLIPTSMLQLNHQDPIVHSQGSRLTADKVPHTRSGVGIGHSQRECSPLYRGEGSHTHRGHLLKEGRKEGNVLFNDALNTFYFTVI